jgi:uncharacterized protein with von Willebrand factor type A (vWA) domain
MPWRHRYSRWDGTQSGFELDADELFAQITDDLLYHGDLNSALRRLLQSGFETPDGEQVQGLRELLEQLRRRKRDTLERHDLGGVYDDIAERLRDVVDAERAELDRLAAQAESSGDERRSEISQQAMAERRLQLDLLPNDLAGQVQGLQQYDFTSSEAQHAFEELLEELREQLLQAQFGQMAEAMQQAAQDPAQMQRMKDMFNDLNALIEARQQGTDTQEQFDDFMGRHGDFFPGNPRNLDELLEQMAQQMAAMQQMLNSMTPEQRAQLHELSQNLLQDMDLAFQASRLGSNLQQMFPSLPWQQGYGFEGDQPLSMGQATSVMQELGDLDQLEQMLRGASNPGALAEVDLDRARELLGDDAAKSLDRLARLAKQLEDAGLLERREGRFELTPRGLRKIGQNALSQLFSKMAKDKLGRHETVRQGVGVERTYDTKAYEFGDPFNLDIQRTVRNAVQRGGAGTPVRLTPDDFEVERTEHLTRSSTVLMLDLSLSMPMRDNFLAAKKVAMALHSLISSQYPRDYLGLVGFSEVARELKPEQLPEVSWDFVYGTNMQHAFVLARRMLARQSGTRQIIMITDGEPTAHLLAGGEPFFQYPTHPATRDATLAEVNRCTREGITINTFMLDASRALRHFVEKMTELNRGRAFFTSPETLGDYVLVDFIEHKRTMSRRRTG